MPPIPPILVSLDANEARRARAQKIKAAILNDDHFYLEDPKKCPFDLRFHWENKTINVELKDFTGDGPSHSDYVASIINPSGHLYQQILAARELEEPLIIAVLGGNAEVVQAITNIVYDRGIRGQEAENKIIKYISMVESFEANCIGLNVQVWRLKINPWKRLLLNVRKMLEGGDLTVFRPRPAGSERQAIGLSILCKRGLGPARSSRILEKFYISLVAKEPDSYLDDCPGIGPKLAMAIQDVLFIPNSRANRPKDRKRPEKL